MHAPRLLLTICTLSTFGSWLSAQAVYETNFDALPAAPAGTALQGVDGFFVPVTAPPSSDFAVHTYGNNSLGIPAHQFGGPNFIAAQSTAGGPATTQRLSAFVADCEVHIEFDICVRYTSAAAPTRREFGGLTLQPEAASTSAGILARWSTAAGVMPTTWDADFVAGPSATVTQVPNPLWQGLALDVWHRWGCSVDLETGHYTGFVLQDGLTGVRTIYTPPLGSAPIAVVPGALPTAFRLQCNGDAGTTLAFDRLSVASHAHYHLFGAGCPGALGVPVLAPIGQPRPVLSLPLTLGLNNLPADVGIISMGFSKSVSGGQPLPFDLGSFGLPGCPLLVDPVASTLIVGTAGQASWNLQIPFNRALMGQFFYNQGFALDQGANAAGVTVSNAGGGCIGR